MHALSQKKVESPGKATEKYHHDDTIYDNNNCGTYSLEQASAINVPTKLGLTENYVNAVRKVTGTDVSDTLVTINSLKPEQVGGLSCAQGSYVDLGKGRIGDIYHETVHVAQQKRGQTQVSMHFNGLPGNSDSVLEKDADNKGARIKHLSSGPIFKRKPRTYPTNPINHPVQRFAPNKDTNPEDSQYDHIRNFTFKDFISYQEDFQQLVVNEPYYFKEQVTTVGFEHEFAQAKFINSDGQLMYSTLLLGLSHMVLAKSDSPKMVITDLPFILETDTRSALELVSPPYLLQTERGRPLPQQKLIDKVDEIVSRGLDELASTANTLGELIKGFDFLFGIRFPALSVPTVKPVNVSHRTDINVLKYYQAGLIDEENIKNIPVSTTDKRFRNNKYGQANIATDLETAFFMEEPRVIPGFEGAAFHNVMQKYIAHKALKLIKHDPIDNNVVYFINFLARVMLTQMSVAPQQNIKKLQNRTFYLGKEIYKESDWQKHSFAMSFIKDFTGIWVKDSIINMGLGVLSPLQWKAVEQMVNQPDFERAFLDLLPASAGGTNDMPNFEKFSLWMMLFKVMKQPGGEWHVFLKAFRRNLRNALNTLRAEVGKICEDIDDDFSAEEHIQAPPEVELYEHKNKRHIRARQDTLLDANKVNNEVMKKVWPDTFLHVVEDRRSLGIAEKARQRIAHRDKFIRANALEPTVQDSEHHTANIELNADIESATQIYGSIVGPYLIKPDYFKFKGVFGRGVVEKYVELNSHRAILTHIVEAFKGNDIPDSLTLFDKSDLGVKPVAQVILNLIDNKKMLWGSAFHKALIRAFEALI